MHQRSGWQCWYTLAALFLDLNSFLLFWQNNNGKTLDKNKAKQKLAVLVMTLPHQPSKWTRALLLLLIAYPFQLPECKVFKEHKSKAITAENITQLLFLDGVFS